MISIEVLADGDRLQSLQGKISFCTVALLRGEQTTIFDVGHAGRRQVIVGALRTYGLEPEDIDNVVVSHVHWDHAQNLDVFPNARVLVHPAERRYAAAPHPNDWATPAWTGAMLEREHDRIVEVDEGFVIEPGMQLLSTPGHSPGTLSVLVDSGNEVSVLSGDAVPSSSSALSGQNPIVFWDDAQARTSIRRIMDLGGTVYPGHDRPFQLRGDEVEYLRPHALTLLNVDPQDPGVRFEQHSGTGFVMPGIEEQRGRLGNVPPPERPPDIDMTSSES